MDGFALRNITPYALALGASNAHIGFLTSIPSILGSAVQLFTPKLMERTSRRKIVSRGVLLQAFMWLPILLIGVMFFVLGWKSSWIPLSLIIAYTTLVVFGGITGPAWNSWMRDIVTTNIGAYFGKRNRICGSVTLVAALAGGLILDQFKDTNIFLGFIILFFCAFLARTAGGIYFTRKYEPELKTEEGYYFSFFEFVKHMRHNNFGRFAIYEAVMSVAVNIGSPFVAVYMLKQLGFSYTTFTIVTLGSASMTLLFMPAWGKFTDKYGNLAVVRITGFFTAGVMALWAASPLVLAYAPKLIVPYLFLTDAFSGFIWAGFNLSTANFLYDAVTRQRVSLCTAYQNVLNGTGVFIGAAAGGLISSLVPINFIVGPLISVFILSAVMRLGVAALMIRKIHEVRPAEPMKVRLVVERLVSMSPEQMLKYMDIKN